MREFFGTALSDHGDVRVSILAPEGIDFTMPYSRNEVVWSDDVRVDDRFTPHPHASRPYNSILSVPISRDDEIVGVLNVIATPTEAFGHTEIIVATILGGVLECAWAMVQE